MTRACRRFAAQLFILPVNLGLASPGYRLSPLRGSKMRAKRRLANPSCMSSSAVVNLRVCTLWAFQVLLIQVALFASEPLPKTIDFNRDIRPVLSDACFQCHGPDEERREVELRLDTRTGALANLGDRRTIVPGNLAKSELYRRITSQDEDERMPPVDAVRKLTTHEVKLIEVWIEQGAPWQEHWSFIPPKRPRLPTVGRSKWPRNPIDSFIFARLEHEGFSPAPRADKTTLIRRLTIDLTGLPPTPGEVDAFLSDTFVDAYDRLIDRLLASPRFGERMASPWLDAARYADTSGYQNDGPRYMWRWRDWVINALNENLPFDRFTIDQLAGDMLPNASLDQIIATGFNRNHRGNAEGGIIPEEYAVAYVLDRVDTTSTVWLGLTMGCAQCHDHKFDPITQKEFYQMFAYFNNVPEHGRAIKEGNSPPWIKAPTPQQLKELQNIESKLSQAEERCQALQGELIAAQSDWEQSAFQNVQDRWSISRDLVAHFALDGGLIESCENRVEPRFDQGDALYDRGKLGQAASFDGQRFVDAGDVGKFGYFDKFSIAAWICLGEAKSDAPETAGGTIVSRMTDTARADGYSVTADQNGRIHVNLVKRWLDDAVRVHTRNGLDFDQWHHLTVTYDGSRVAKGISVYIDGKPVPIEVKLDAINQSFKTEEPLRIGGGGGREGRFRGRIDDVRVFSRCLSPTEAQIVATADSISEILSIAPDQRTVAQATKLHQYFLSHHAPEHIRHAFDQLAASRDRRSDLVDDLPTVMVMQEMETPRETFVLRRGQYDQPGELVSPGLPACLPPMRDGQRNSRLGFARWIVDPSNPLTGRVAANRYWQMFFGTGIVKTAEDFGSQGQRPSHPRLLDWLATEYARVGWDTKALLKTIVSSATYQQSSKLSSELSGRDPENKLLARGPRFRLSAEIVRDQALAASGLLVERIGGPSVRPYQPEGLWKEIASDTDYQQSKGEGLYRRSLYTYWKRTVASPTMMTFDATPRETCTVVKPRTNTPLQALALMNDVTFMECARVLAQRVLTEGGRSADQRIERAFRLVTARQPTESELAILRNGLARHHQRYRDDPDTARALINTGEYPQNPNLDVSEHAAYTVVANLILSMDEVIVKE